MFRYLICVLGLVLLCAVTQAEEPTLLEQAIHGYLADPDNKADKPAAKPAPEQPWDITAGLGVAYTDGNSNTLTVAFNLNAKKEWGKWKSTTGVRIGVKIRNSCRLVGVGFEGEGSTPLREGADDRGVTEHRSEGNRPRDHHGIVIRSELLNPCPSAVGERSAFCSGV